MSEINNVDKHNRNKMWAEEFLVLKGGAWVTSSIISTDVRRAAWERLALMFLLLQCVLEWSMRKVMVRMLYSIQLSEFRIFSIPSWNFCVVSLANIFLVHEIFYRQIRLDWYFSSKFIPFTGFFGKIFSTLEWILFSLQIYGKSRENFAQWDWSWPFSELCLDPIDIPIVSVCD